ncbi:MAG: ATP-binding protein, partial [Cyclobacteriaceae bacterium]
MAFTEIFTRNSRNNTDGWKKNPFKALDPYSEEESQEFYGRKDEVQNLYYHVKQNYLTVLYGESGVGKSSVINAGLVPLLRKKNLFPILLRTSAILNEEEPARFVLRQVIEEAQKRSYTLFDDFEGKTIDPESSEYLDKTLWEFFHQVSFYKKHNSEPEKFNVAKNTLPLLIFDQFEEIFSAPVSSRKEKFINELASLVENYPLKRVWQMEVSNELPNCKILISLKSESIPKLGKLSNIIPSISQTRNKVMLDRLTDSQGAFIINQLGNEHGTKDIFPKETIDHIINEISSFDDLGNLEKRKVQPYFLSLYCHEVYDNVINRKNKANIQVADLQNDTEVLKRFY